MRHIFRRCYEVNIKASQTLFRQTATMHYEFLLCYLSNELNGLTWTSQAPQGQEII